MGNLRAKFFRDGDFDRVEISIVGNPDTVIAKVEPKHVTQFPVEWAAYREGNKEIDYGGTDLTEVPGVDAKFATALRLNGVHNAEMLAGISDAAAKGLGMGGITVRDAAKLLLKMKRLEAMNAPADADLDDDEILQSGVGEVPRRRGRPPKVTQIESAPE